MVPNICRFCEHGNPEGAKFCSECGGCLHLLPCPSCGAVTDVSAVTCYQCKAPLPWHNTTAVAPVTAVAEVARPQTRWRTPVLAGVAALAVVVAALGYYGYRQRSSVIAAQPPAAGGQLRAARQAAESSQPQAPAAASAAAGGVVEQASSPATPCTGAAAALGTCAPQGGAQKGAQGIAAVRDARPQSGEATTTTATESPRPEGCAESIAALGLCTSTTPKVTHTQGRE